MKTRPLQATLLVLGCFLSANDGFAQYGAPDGEWHTWGGDAGFTRYSALDQINAQNAATLQVAWRWQALALGERPDINMKATPLMIGGVLYVPSGEHQVVALNPGSGQELWRYTPPSHDAPPRGLSLGSRSLAFWQDQGQTRLFHNTLDGRLLSIDAKTGKADPAFGEGGVIDLRQGLYPDGSDADSVGSSSPAAVVGDIVVVQVVGRITAPNTKATPGHIRGYDVRTGELRWRFNTIPQPGEPGHDSWQDDAWSYTGNAGVWSMMSVDPETGYIYLPVEAASNDFYGGHRPGNNLFAQSLVCLDGQTGELVWYFQLTHHGLWDYDPPSAPILGDISVNGRTIQTVTQLTKQGLSFVFDRKTGEPVWPIEERPVPQSEVPGEQSSLTQPFPSRPPPYLSLGFHEEDLIDFTPELREQALEIADQYVTGPLYTPPTPVREGGTQGTWVNPGYQGGSNWNGAAFDPETGHMYVPLRKAPMVASLGEANAAETDWRYLRERSIFIQGPEGLPIMRPPWSLVTATDMNQGRHVWSTNIGPAPESVQSHPALQGLDLDFENMGYPMIRPSPLLTSELLFLAEAGHLSGDPGGPMFRAYHKETGSVVAEIELPSKATGAPMTYQYQGHQYIVVAVATTEHPAELVALALPSAPRQASAERREVSRGDQAQQGDNNTDDRVVLSEQAQDQGLQLFVQHCAVCHGQDGSGVEGGTAPGLSRQSNRSAVAAMIQRGGVEMPAFDSRLSHSDIELLAAFVVSAIAQ